MGIAEITNGDMQTRNNTIGDWKYDLQLYTAATRKQKFMEYLIIAMK